MNQKSNIHQERYINIRHQIKNGDILMYGGRSLVSRIIRWVTRSRYSHAGLAVWWNDRLVVLEAVGKGIIVTPLSKNVRHYNGRVEWFTSSVHISDIRRKQLVVFAQEELGKEYALWKSILFALKILFKRPIDNQDGLQRERKLFCSTYIAQAYNSIGVDLKEGVSDKFMSPNDIATSPLMKRVAILNK